MVLGYLLLADGSPCSESLVRSSQGIRHVKARPIPSKVIVRRVSIFLQLSKRVDYFLEVRFDWGRRATLKFGPDHLSVLEHPSEPYTLIGPPPVENEIGYEQMEKRVVCG
jgi:hypothetical protein